MSNDEQTNGDRSGVEEGSGRSGRPQVAMTPAAKIPPPQSNMRRAMGVVRTVLPVVQRLLPLIDGNIASVVASILGPAPMRAQAPVDLGPLESAVSRLRAENTVLRDKIDDQHVELRRIGDELQSVREASEGQTEELKEMRDSLDSLQMRVTVVEWVGLGLLALSIAANVFLFLRVENILH